MEVVSIVLSLVFLVVVGWFAFGLAALAFSFLLRIWPAIPGVGLGAILWGSGQDNVGAVFCIVGILAMFWWLEFAEEKGLFRRLDFFKDDGPGPMAGKRRHYDKDGNIRGYSDDE